MKTTFFICFATLLILFSSCDSTESETSEIVELQVAHYKAVASGPFPGLYFVTQSSEETANKNWSIQYSTIENFDYEWGYTYKILAEKRYFNEQNNEPLMDAPIYRYTLIEEISKEKVNPDSTFNLGLQRTYSDGEVETFVEKNAENEFTLLGIKPFDCSNFCNELTKEEARDTNTYLRGTFQHTENENIELIDLKRLPIYEFY